MPTATAAPLPPPPYRAAAVAVLAVFALYVATLAPSAALWDASEYITAAHVLGIPHPPGNPLFVLVGNVAAQLPIPGTTVAVRVNLLAALCSALAAGAWFLLAERVLARGGAGRAVRLVGGAVAALLGATAFTVWNQSVVNEKVYTVSLAILAAVAWLMVRWCEEPDGRAADRRLLLVAYLIGLGYANHPAGLLPLPAVACAVLWHRPRTLRRGRLLLAATALLALGLTPFATQPIRAAHFPAINQGEPTGCTERIGVRCTFSRTTWTRLMANVDREQYGKPSLLVRQAPLHAQLGMWWQYFEWQWVRDAYGERPAVQRALAILFLALGLVGAHAHRRRDPATFRFVAPLVATLGVGLVVYLNFRYGATQAPHLGDSVPREVRDRDYFYLWSFSSWSVWAALGLVTAWEVLGARLGAVHQRLKLPAGSYELAASTFRAQHRGPSSALLLASPILLLALVPLIANRAQATRAGDTIARDFAHDLLNSVEPYGILVTAGDNDTFPLWYAQEVEGIRRDVTVAVTSLLNTDWYVRGLLRRPVHPYDAARGPAAFRDRAWPAPTAPVLDLTIAEADAVPPYVMVDGPRRFVHGAIDATVDARRLQYGVIERADLLVLQMIRDNVGRPGGRPIHFSRTTGGYPAALGLDAWTISQGLARRLLPAVPTAGGDTLLVPGDGWLDVRRSERLWQESFRGPDAIVRRGEWPDRPSVGIALTYVFGGMALAEGLTQAGAPERVPPVLDTIHRVAAATRTTALLGLDPADAPAVVPGDAPRGVAVPVR